MKIIQTDSQLEIQKGTISRLITGAILIVIGVGVVIAALSGVIKVNEEPAPWWIGLLGVAFGIAGAALILTASKTKILFQLGAETVIEKTRLIGGKTTHEAFATSLISTVQIDARVEKNINSSDTTNNRSQSYSRHSNLYLLLHDGRKIDIDVASQPEYNQGLVGASTIGVSIGQSSSGRIPLSDEAGQIANFLNVPINVNDATMQLNPATVSRVVDAFRGDQPQEPTTIAGQPQIVQPPVAPTSPQTGQQIPSAQAMPSAEQSPVDPVDSTYQDKS